MKCRIWIELAGDEDYQIHKDSDDPLQLIDEARMLATEFPDDIAHITICFCGRAHEDDERAV